MFDDISEFVYVDLTTAGAIKTAGAIESDAVTSVVNGSPRSPLHSVANPPTPELASQLPDLAHLPPDQAPYPGDDVPASGIFAGYDKEQGIATADATERSAVTGDATPVETPILSLRSTPDPPTLARASQPPTPSPLDIDDAPSRGDDDQNSIPGIRDASLQRQPSLETP